MALDITVDVVGRRHYFRGNTYPVKDALRAAGAHWDAQERAWWVGKREVAESLLASLSAKPASPPSVTDDAPKSDRPVEAITDETVVRGRARYKGKEYLLLWDGQTRRGHAAKLAFTDGSRVFWADGSQISVTKIYDTHEYRGQVRQMTFGKLRRFREDMAAEKATAKALEKTDGVVGARGEYQARYQASKSNRTPGRELGSPSWLRHQKRLIAVVLVGYEPATYVRSEDAEDMGHYDVRSGYYGYEHFRAATPEEYEALQRTAPRAEGTCAGDGTDSDMVADIKERVAADAAISGARAAIPAWIAQQVKRSEHYVGDSSVKVPAGAWSYSLGLRAAGSETLYFAPGSISYIESSYDDGPRMWSMPIGADQVSMFAAAMRALTACTKHRDCRSSVELGLACVEAA